VIEALKAAFVRGRLTKAELDTRVGQALSARTYADLAALTTDIPPTSAATRPERPPAPARRRPLARAVAGAVAGSGGCPPGRRSMVYTVDNHEACAQADG
jgi:hypothetical protein